MIDHDLQDGNMKDPLDLELAPFEGFEVERLCPLCLHPLREFPLEETQEGGGYMTVGGRLECQNCDKTTAYYRDMEKAAAATAQWQKSN
jgi:hypothetical protein